MPGTIQKVIASPSGSTLQAGPGNITLVGGQGNDWLARPGTGTQTLIAGTGDDTLVAGIGTDKLEGRHPAGDVRARPGHGHPDQPDDQPGQHPLLRGAARPEPRSTCPTQLYVPHGSPVPAPIPPAGGWGAGATVSLAGAEISQVIGSPEADIFVTGSTPVNITGNGGNDLFVVTSGSNTLTAGTGSASRFLFDGAGGNIINGGGNSTVDFSLAPAGVDVDLQQPGVATGGFGGTQSLTGIQNVIGTNSADVLIAGAQRPDAHRGSTAATCSRPVPPGVTPSSPAATATTPSVPQVSCNGMTAAAGGNTMTGGTGDDNFFAQNGGRRHHHRPRRRCGLRRSPGHRDRHSAQDITAS